MAEISSGEAWNARSARDDRLKSRPVAVPAPNDFKNIRRSCFIFGEVPRLLLPCNYIAVGWRKNLGDWTTR